MTANHLIPVTTSHDRSLLHHDMYAVPGVPEFNERRLHRARYTLELV